MLQFCPQRLPLSMKGLQPFLHCAFELLPFHVSNITTL